MHEDRFFECPQLRARLDAEFLRGLLREEDSDIRARAAASLGRVGYRAAIPELLEATGDPAWPVRAMAAKALGLLQVETAVPQLCAGLRDREWWVRANSAGALRALGPPVFTPFDLQGRLWPAVVSSATEPARNMVGENCTVTRL